MNVQRNLTLDLEIQYAGAVEVRRVTETQPFSIGRHASNDLCVAEPDVAPIHCRLSWNGLQFEVVAGGREGVDHNGTLVHQSALKSGDVLRIGSADVVVGEERESEKEDPPSPSPSPSSREIPFKPVTQETEAVREGWDRSDFVAVPWLGNPALAAPGGEWNRTPLAVATPPSPGPLDPEDLESDIPIRLRVTDIKRPPEEPFSVRLSRRLTQSPVRPGEQEALRSPVILGMFAAALALALAALAIYFVIGRESAQQEYDAAAAQFTAHRYAQSIELYRQFLHDHPGHRLATDARYGMWNATVLKEINAGSPSWKRGVEAVNQYLEANQDRSDFHQHRADVADFLTQIAVGAAETAGRTKQRDLLKISSTAQSMAERYAPEANLSAEWTGRIRSARSAAEEAILQFELVNAKVVEIDKANAAHQPMQALAARRALLAQYPPAEYPQVAADPRLAKLLEKTLQVEKSLVVREELNQPARTAASGNARPKGLCLTVHTGSRTEEQSSTRPVFVLAKDCCYAVDHVTGNPLWRRVIGFDSPFFPMSVETSRAGLLLFDTNRLALVLLARETGDVIWEQRLGEAVSGPPLVNQGQIYLATLGNHLDQIDLETGRISARLSFSQQILSPPALVRNNERLVVAGDASLIYTLSTAPLSCIRVTDMGHPAGSLVDGVRALGGLVLLTETGPPSGTVLHVLQAKDDDAWLAPLKKETIEGQVRDAPVVYGTMLFIASVPPRITAFAVSDAPGHEAVTQTTSLAIPNQEESPIFLSAGPDGQLWMAGSSLRRLVLALNARSFALDPIETAVGISTQPLQVVGQYLFAARRLPYAGSVFFSQVDREPMAGQWRTILGSSILAHIVPPSGDLVLIGEAGGVHTVSAAEVRAGGFKQVESIPITLAPDAVAPLRATALSEGRVAVECAGPPAKFWIIGQLGQVESSFTVEQPLEAPPVQLDSGIVLPLPGRLRLVSSSGVPVGEDYLAPIEKGKPSAWKAAARLDANDLLALDSSGQLTRLQFRSDPGRHLAVGVTQRIDRPVDLSPCVVGSRVAYADSDPQLHVLDTAALQPVFSAKLSSPAIGMWPEGSSVLIETRDHDLLAYDLSGQPKPQFHVALRNTGPAGSSKVIGGRLIVPCRNGTVLALDPSTGAELSRMAVGQWLVGDAIDFHGQPVVTSVDGSVYPFVAASGSKPVPTSKEVSASKEKP